MPENIKVVNYIVLELAHGGELFDFIANTGMFGESLARYFFIQLSYAAVTHASLSLELN